MLLLSRIKVSIFVLTSSTEFNINFIYHKKGKRTKFLFQTQNICLNDLTVAFVLKITRPIIFFAVKKVSFPHSRKIFLMKELFHCQRNFPQKYFI